MISPETLALISTFKSPLIELFKDAKDEVSHFLDSGLSDYVDCTYNKYVFTKTFLYRNDKVNFYDIYFPVSLKIKNKRKTIDNLTQLFEDSSFVTIIGNAGSGKSMLMKHFFLNSVKTSFKIPIVFELRALNETSGTFEEIIFKTIYNNKLSPNDKILERLLSSGEFIFLLDGFDEIYSTQKERITFEIDNFIDKYNKNNFLITSRPGSGIESMPRFDNYFVQPLNDEEIIQFIDLQLVDDENQKLAQKIKQVIKKKENLDYKNFLGSPLLLSMFILTFNSYPELPKKKSKFYWNVFDTLATKHDSFTKKGGFLHERKTKLQNEDFEEILKWLAYLSFFEGHYSFDSKYLTEKLNQIKSSFKFSFNTNELIEDLTLAISIIVIDGVEYRFPHKSLQEYFCAMLIKDLAPENKEKIYKEKFWDQLRQTFGGYENFWNLCYEVDKKHFVKNVLIYSLEYFLNRIRYKDLSKKMKKIYQLTGFSDRASYKDGNLIISGNSRSVTPFLWVTEYLNIYAYDIFSLKNATQTHQKEIESLFLDETKVKITNKGDEKENRTINYYKNWDNDIENIVLNSVIKNNILLYLEKVKTVTNELKTEIRETNKNTINLLNI